MAPGIQTCSSSLRGKIVVDSPNIRYGQDFIEADYEYQNTRCSPNNNGTIQATPVTTVLTLRTERKVPRMGLMLAGWGGNNGSTVTAAILANRLGLEWETKDGKVKANYFGSLTQSATFNVGIDDEGRDVYSPMRDLVPMVNPNDIVLDGWDISNLNLADAMKRSAVLDINLQKLLYPHMKNMVPRKAIFDCDFVAANQAERANNVILSKNKIELIKQIERDIQDFKKSNNLDTVIVLWTANTERFTDVRAGVHDTWEHLESALKRNHSEIAPSTLYAIASINQGCTFINGSAQNTLIPGVIELAEQKNVFLGGDDFKSGQTKLKSVMVDFLVGAGIKPCSIVSYNHLGNNDGYNLSAPQTFRSKEISKSGVVDDMVGSNSILYGQGLSHPDHCVVIKYVPYVGDSKRAMDEYISELMLGGKNTIICHNTCEDSLLASPIIIDLAILAELCQRVKFFVHGKNDGFVGFNCILSLLSYLCKAPLVEKGAQIVNALAKQRSALENFLRALVSLPPVDNLYLQNKLPSRKYWYEQPKESVIARGKGNNISAIGKAVHAEE